MYKMSMEVYQIWIAYPRVFKWGRVYGRGKHTTGNSSANVPNEV